MTLPLLLLLPALLVGSALASGAETALFTLTHADRTRLARSSPTAAGATSALLRNPRMLLLTILLLNNAVNVTYFVVVSVLAWRLGGPEGAAAVGLAGLLAIVLVGEVLAKLLAARFRLLYCRALAAALLAVHTALGPIRAALNAVLEPLVRLAAPGRARPPAVTPRELEALLEQHAKVGVIDESERRVLAGVMALGTDRVRDVMTPHVDIRWLRHTDGDQEILRAVEATRRAKLPVCRGSPEREVLGMLAINRYFSLRDAGRRRDDAFHAAIESPLFVPETARLDQLLDLFRSRRRHVALCVDEHGSITGMVEIEDVVRDLLLTHPDDRAEQDELVRRLSERAWSVSGRLSVRDWDELIGVPRTRAPTGAHVGTVAGLLLAHLGRLPRVGDSVTVGGIRLTVESMDGRAIRRVRIEASSTQDPSP